MNAIATFEADAIATAIAEFGPAKTVALGKTATDRRLMVIQSASTETRLFACAQGGKVGKAAREGLQFEGIARITSAAAKGNYKPLSETLALIMGESVHISNRAAYESLKDRYIPIMDDLTATGKKWRTTKSGEEKLTSKYATLMQCLSVIEAVYAGVDAIFAQKDAE